MIKIDKIYTAVPTRGTVLNSVVNKLNELHDVYGLPTAIYETGHLSAIDARNKIRKNFLNSDKEVLLMLDYDVIPVYGVVEMAMRGYDICATPVMLMAEQANIPFFNVYNEDISGDGWWPIQNQFNLSSVIECDAVGFGVVAIHRKVVEKLSPFWLDTDEYGIANRSEDLPYCKLAKKNGFRVWADFSSRADHITMVNIRDLQERNSVAFEKYLRVGKWQ